MVKILQDTVSLEEARTWIDERLESNKFEQENELWKFKYSCERKSRDKLKEIPADFEYFVNDEYKKLLEEERNLKYAQRLLRQIVR